MTVATWRILAVLVLTYVTVAVAKYGDPSMRNDEPRLWLAQLGGWRRRLMAAHANHWEAFAPFSIGVLVAQTAGGRQSLTDTLAMTFVVLRVTYTLFYAQGLASARSVVWFLGLACIIALYVVPVLD